MGYGPEDMGVFRLLRDKALLDGTAYFELHPGEPPEPYACWLDGSVFMKDAGFDFFTGCFEEAKPGWDYFAFEPFDALEIFELEASLSRFSSSLQPGCPREAVFGRFSSLFADSIWSDVPTEALRLAVSSGAGELHSFVSRTRLGGTRLWVMGM